MTDFKHRRSVAGLALVGGSAGLIATANWLLSGGYEQHLLALVIAVGMVAVASAVPLLLRGHRTVIGYPFVLFAGLGALGAVSSSLGTAFAGLITIAFIYLGLTGSRRVVLFALAPAVGCWMLVNGAAGGRVPDAAAVRLPIAVVIWATVGILLSQHTDRMKQTASSLHDQAFRDPLTGLHNRRALAELSKWVTPGDALVLLDLDHFKRVNDTQGHIGGDALLSEFATLLSDSLRVGDSALRYGGEEFLLFLPATATGQVRGILDRLHATWEASNPITTFSAGAAVITAEHGIIEAMGLADQRLYAAKEAGRNCSVVDDSAHSEAPSRLTLVRAAS